MINHVEASRGWTLLKDDHPNKKKNISENWGHQKIIWHILKCIPSMCRTQSIVEWKVLQDFIRKLDSCSNKLARNSSCSICASIFMEDLVLPKKKLCQFKKGRCMKVTWLPNKDVGFCNSHDISSLWCSLFAGQNLHGKILTGWCCVNAISPQEKRGAFFSGLFVCKCKGKKNAQKEVSRQNWNSNTSSVKKMEKNESVTCLVNLQDLRGNFEHMHRDISDLHRINCWNSRLHNYCKIKKFLRPHGAVALFEFCCLNQILSESKLLPKNLHHYMDFFEAGPNF